MPGPFGGLEPESLQGREHFDLRLWRACHSADLAKAVEDDVQRPLRHDSRIKLLERSGGRVARIGKGLLAGRPTLLVEFLETRPAEVNLATHFEQGRSPSLPVQNPEARWHA